MRSPEDQALYAPDYDLGACIWDGAGQHSSNEDCTIHPLKSSYLALIEFDTEAYYE